MRGRFAFAVWAFAGAHPYPQRSHGTYPALTRRFHRTQPQYPFIIPPGLFDVHFDPIDADEMSGFLSSNASVNDPVGAPAGANTFYSGDSSNFFRFGRQARRCL